MRKLPFSQTQTSFHDINTCRIYNMSEDKRLKVGDKLVDFGQVFRIFKIETKENSDGEIERILHFRPFYKTGDYKGMVCSIPENSLANTKIRRPVSKETASEIVKKLKNKPEESMATDIDTVKQILGNNDPHETMRVVRSMWIEKIKTDTTFTKSKSDIFELAIYHLAEEIALVTNASPDTVHKKVKNTLEKAHK